MAEGKNKKTLLDVVKPFILVFNLIYGFHLGNRKPAGCLKLLHRKLLNGLYWFTFLNSSHAYYHSRFQTHVNAYDYRWIIIVAIFCCSFYLFAANEPELERLVMRLKEYPIGECSQRATSKMKRVFFIALALFFLPVIKFLYTISCEDLSHLNSSTSLNAIFPEDFSKLKNLMLLLFFIVSIVSFFNFALSLLFLPVLMSILCCTLVSYCPSRLDDQMEDIRRAHSPLRRARLLTQLCYAYYRLQPLASMTNRNMATAMSLFKLLTMLLWAFCFNVMENSDLDLKFNLPLLPYSVPLLVYLKVAPTANDTQSKVLKAAAEVLMTDDEWQVRDPISRSHLLKMRLNLLKHLDHIRMDQGPFTLLGDSVDPTNFFMIFVEINDLRTTLR